jgi:hypothetical protein
MSLRSTHYLLQCHQALLGPHFSRVYYPGDLPFIQCQTSLYDLYARYVLGSQLLSHQGLTLAQEAIQPNYCPKFQCVE